MRRSSFILLAVLSVLAIGAFLFVHFLVPKIAEDRRARLAYEDLRYLSKSVEEYKSATAVIPTTADGLRILVERPKPSPAKWKRIIEAIPMDPWGDKYRYRTLPHGDARGFEIRSAEPDGVDGTTDDLSSLDPIE